MISEKGIRNNLEMISFPRLSGTNHEQRAADLIIDKIKDLNLVPQVQKFTYSSFYSRIYKKIAFSLIFWLVFVLFLDLSLLFTLINVIMIIIIFFPLILYTRKPEDIPFGKMYTSKNIYIDLKSEKRSKQIEKYYNIEGTSDHHLQLIFISHIDSKSQTLAINLRVFSLKLWIYSIIVISVSLIVKYLIYNNFLFDLVIAIELVINLIGTILILFNTSKNRSDGAIDNGSGVSMVLELLKYYSEPQNRPENIDLWFVFTGAEETGTMGIRYFQEEIKKYDKKKVIFFNIDSVAQNLDIFGTVKLLSLKTDFFRLFFSFMRRLSSNIILKRYISAVTHSDGYYLKKKGYLGLDFGDKSSYKYIHSPEDKIDKVDPVFLSDICSALIKFINKDNIY